MFIVSFLKGKHFVREGMCLFGLEGPWILIHLDSSVAHHLTDSGVPGSNFRSSQTFPLVFLTIDDMRISLYIYASVPPIPSTDLF